MSDRGRVYFVGAGPGDPGLITRKGLDLLRSCDVVFVDGLVAPALLAELKPGARRAPARSATAKEMADLARAGEVVVHLVAGDPFAFSPAVGEALELARHDVDVEVVPGISPALAAPAYAGIPLTRDERGTVTIAGGTATDDTLVLTTDATGLKSAIAALLRDGRDPDQPVAVIQWGTTNAQRVIERTLGEAGEAVAAAGLKGPVVAVVGDVATLRKSLVWFERKPLFGLRVVVTRGRGQAGALSSQLGSLGAAVVEMPVIEIADPPSWDDLDQAIRLLAEGFFKWTIFTSANAVEKLFARVDAASLDSRAFGRVKVAAVGSSTAGLLTERGIRPDLVPPQFTGAAIAESLGRGSGRVLLPRVEDAPAEIVDALAANGWHVREVTAYRNLTAGKDSPAAGVVAAGRFDVVTFTSASTVRNFVAIAGSEVDGGVACIGPVTADAARAAGLRVDVVAEEHTVPGLVSAVVERWGSVGR